MEPEAQDYGGHDAPASDGDRANSSDRIVYKGDFLEKIMNIDTQVKVMFMGSSVLPVCGQVLDTYEKLRQTLCHEMCHAAAW